MYNFCAGLNKKFFIANSMHKSCTLIFARTIFNYRKIKLKWKRKFVVLFIWEIEFLDEISLCLTQKFFSKYRLKMEHPNIYTQEEIKILTYESGHRWASTTQFTR